MSKNKSTFYTRPAKLLADYVWWCINENTLNLMTWEREHARVRYDTVTESWKAMMGDNVQYFSTANDATHWCELMILTGVDK